MILDHLDNAQRYLALHPGFAAAFKFLKTADARKLAPGRIEVDGAKLYVIVAEGQGRGREKAELEVHHKYIDIQLVVEGLDDMGWKSTGQCRQRASEYIDKDDYEMFADAAEAWFTAPPGMFAVFFPEDAHAPACGPKNTKFKKLIAKVAVENGK